jgi:hypothetical protein
LITSMAAAAASTTDPMMTVRMVPRRLPRGAGPGDAERRTITASSGAGPGSFSCRA